MSMCPWADDNFDPQTILHGHSSIKSHQFLKVEFFSFSTVDKLLVVEKDVQSQSQYLPATGIIQCKKKNKNKNTATQMSACHRWSFDAGHAVGVDFIG